MGTDTATARLQVFNTQLKVRMLHAQGEALSQRHSSLLLELEMIPKKLKELEDQRNELVDEFNEGYKALKEEMDVPEGSEINLETGEVVPSK